jgi:Glycosyl hydrolases family 16
VRALLAICAALIASSAVGVILTSSAGPRSTVYSPHVPHLEVKANLLACVSADCGPYAATFAWAGVSIAGQTGYYVYLNAVQVADVTNPPYVFRGLDCGTSSTFGVRAHDGSGGQTTLYSYVYTAPACGGSLPVSTGEPIASGDVATGNIVSTSTGSWSGSPSSYSYQWQRCPTDGTACSDIGGATSQNYTVAAGDSGQVLRAQVRATNGSGTSSPAPSTMIPFGDVFANDTAVDTNLWLILDRNGDSTQSESGCYVPGGVSLSGGSLTLTATHQTVNPCHYGLGQASTTSQYATGSVQAKDFNFRYGVLRYKVAFSCANGSGCWPAFWSYDASLCQWPNNLDTCPGFARDEMDWAENVWNGGTMIQDEDVYTVAAGWRTCNPAGVNPFISHVYEVDWTSSSIVFKVDGATTNCTVSSNLPITPAVMIYNMAMGGNGGSINNNALPTSVKLDWVYVTTDSPDNTVRPTLTDTTSAGRFAHGDTLSMSNGTWASGQACGSGLTCTYKWIHCNPAVSGTGYCSAIGGATGSTYTLSSGDTGDYVEGVMTAANGTGGQAAAATTLSPAIS